MTKCARCGSDNAKPPRFNIHREYEYCAECQDEFEQAKENGVVIRSRHSNRDFDRLPYVVEVNVEGIDNPHTQSISSPNKPENQTAAFAMAKDIMDKHNIRGLFIYQKTGSLWLIDEYLEAHPGIAEDVEDERGGFFSGLLR